MNDPAELRLEVRVHVDEADEPPHSSRLRTGAVRTLVEEVLSSEGIRWASVGVVFCGDERIADLNREWLDHQGPTDVISFNLSGHPAEHPAAPEHTVQERPEPLEGEIYVDLAQAARQAPGFGVSLEEELRRLIIHGTLHLTGWDDAEEEEAARMRERQEELVAALQERVLEDQA